MAPVAAATFTLLAAFCIVVYLCVYSLIYMYYFYALKERERLTCVRVDWVYSCDVSSRERKEGRRGRLGLETLKFYGREDEGEKKFYTTLVFDDMS